MASTVETTVPISLFRNRQGSFIPLPLNEVNAIDSIISHRVDTVPRDQYTGDLQGGNFIQRSRLDLFGRYLLDSDYASGVLDKSGCRLHSINQQIAKLPVIDSILTTGYYNYGEFVHYLYSALSNVEKADTNPVTLTLTPDAGSPLSVVLWTRGPCNDPVPHRNVLEVLEFTEELDTVGRQTGVNSTVLDEYTYDSETLILTMNRDIRESLTVPDPDTATTRELLCYGDLLGYSDASDCQYFYTKYFPIDDSGQLRVYTLFGEADDRVDLQEWTIVSDFSSGTLTDYHVTFDTDLGILKFGGVRGGDALLSDDLLVGDLRAIPVHDSRELAYRGRVELYDGVNSEIVEYTGKTETELLGITRTAPLAWPDGTTIRTLQTGVVPTAYHRVVVLYEAVPRIEYLPWLESWSDTFPTLAQRVNSKFAPFRLQDNESILAIDRCDQKLHQIVLTPLDIGHVRLGSGRLCHGPVYPNENIIAIEGQALDESGTPIVGIEVTVYVPDGPGSIDYVDSVTAITNSDGKFWVHFIPDAHALYSPIYARSGDVSYDAGDTLIDFNYPSSYDIDPADLNLLHVYAVLKDDPTLGTVGKFWDVPILDWSAHPDIGNLIGSSLAAEVPGYIGAQSLTEGILAVDALQIGDVDSWTGGRIRIGRTPLPFTGPVQPITYEEYGIERVIRDPGFWVTRPDARIFLNTFVIGIDQVIPAVTNSIVEVWIRRADDVDWDPVTLNGRKTVLRVEAGYSLAGDNPGSYTPWVHGDDPDDGHTTASNWIHPNSDETDTVYKPVTAKAHEGGNVLRFGGNLPLPDQLDNSNVLGAYAIFGQAISTVRASGKVSECFDKFVLSNEVCFYNTLSPRDTGTIAVNAGYVPYGFRLISDTFDAASTLDTATYLTLNDIHRVSASAPYRAPLISVIEDGAIIYDSEIYDPYPVMIGFEIVATA